MVRLYKYMWEPIESEITKLLWDVYYKPIIDLFNDPLYNSRSAVISALRTGKITYVDGVFSGSFTIAISKDLSNYATYDKRSNTWKGNPPPDVKAAAVIANSKAKQLHDRIKKLLPQFESDLDKKLNDMKYTLDSVVDEIDGQIKTSLNKIGIKPEINPVMSDRLKEDYTNNQNLTIKGWNEEQIIRLRDIVQESVLEGYRKNNLIAYIMQEWGVTKNKAKFWARQETSLFMSKLRRERYLDGGVNKYKWSTSHDERVRDRHKELNGKVFTFGNPPVTDDKGNRNKPGEDFNCRCVAIPVI